MTARMKLARSYQKGGHIWTRIYDGASTLTMMGAYLRRLKRELAVTLLWAPLLGFIPTLHYISQFVSINMQWILFALFAIFGIASVFGAVDARSEDSEDALRFSRSDRDFRPLQFGKRASEFRPLQFGKRDSSFRPLQFGKRGPGGLAYPPSLYSLLAEYQEAGRK